MKKVIQIVGVFLFALGLWFFLTPPSSQKLGKGVEHPPIPVTTLEVKGKELSSFNEFAGTVQSSLTMQVSSRIVAHIREISVYAGAIVKKGDVLVRLDDGDIQAKLKQAQSVLLSTQATKEEATKDVVRYRKLVQERIESRQKLDQIEAKEKSALAAVETVREQIVEIQEMMAYTEIKAPWDAVVVEKFAEQGDLASPNRVLLTLQDPFKLRLEAPVSEHCARRIHTGDMVFAKVASLETEIETKVSEIVPAVDPKSRSFLVRASLPALVDLKPGMFGRLRFPCAPRTLLLIPVSSIVSQGQLDTVFVVIDGKARLRMLRLGEHYKDHREVLAGLKEGESIVALPSPTLRDGDRVEEKRT